MKVFVAGASGTLGGHVVRELVAREHEVVGMTRSDSRRARLEEWGARAAVGDALDRDSVLRLIREAKPEAVISVLTSLPRTGPKRLRDMEPTNRLRDEGTRNVLAAAVDVGARRFVGESIIAIYGYTVEGEPATESRPPGRESHPGVQRVIDAIRSAERQVQEATESGRVEGLSLRFGFYHGAGAPSSRYLFDAVRRRALPLIGGGHAIHSWIEVQDAARAVADALERGRAGSVLNVVDDEPVEFRDYLSELARLADAKPPLNVPYGLARLAMPYAAKFLSRSRIPASNERLKRELGWRPHYPTYREALAPLATGGSEEGRPGSP